MFMIMMRIVMMMIMMRIVMRMMMIISKLNHPWHPHVIIIVIKVTSVVMTKMMVTMVIITLAITCWPWTSKLLGGRWIIMMMMMMFRAA